VKIKWSVCKVLRTMSGILQIQPLLFFMPLRSFESGREEMTTGMRPYRGKHCKTIEKKVLSSQCYP
jgi:hypothetical protein